MAARRLLTLYTKPGCTLCDEVKEVVHAVATRIPLTLQEVNIDEPSNVEWRRKYFYDIPVVHWNNTEIFRHRTTEKALEEILSRRPPP